MQKIAKKRGRPEIWSKNGRPSKLEEILKLFPEDGSRIQAKELRQNALKLGISPHTLFPYLRRLEDNFQVIKEVEVPAKPPKVYYKRITEEEFFGREAFLESEKSMKQIWSNLERLPKGYGMKKFLFAQWLWVLTGILTKIGSKAREIKDVNKRKEFIDITIRIHLIPKLLKLSSLTVFESKDWESGLYTFAEFIQSLK